MVAAEGCTSCWQVCMHDDECWFSVCEYVCVLGGVNPVLINDCILAPGSGVDSCSRLCASNPLSLTICLTCSLPAYSV